MTDASEVAAHARSMAGLDFLRALIAGDLPKAPIQHMLGFDLTEVAEGRAVFRHVPREELYNPIGTVHGGVAATLLDSAMGAAVQTTLAAGEGYATLEFKVNLVRAITVQTGEVVAEGSVLHRGSRSATVEARLTRQEDGRLLAHATSTLLLAADSKRDASGTASPPPRLRVRSSSAARVPALAASLARVADAS